MQQIANNILVLQPGDQMPPNTQDSIKIYLGGTVDFGSQENDWQGKFMQGMINLTDPYKGLIMFKNANIIFLNPKIYPTSNAAPALDNPEFVQQMQWRLQMQDMADVVFLNLLMKSKSYVPILEFGSLVQSNKLIVRASENYLLYPQIRLYCEKFNIPLLTGKTTVKDVILTMGSFLPKIKDLNDPNNKLPE
jgi:hypothetical protein